MSSTSEEQRKPAYPRSRAMAYRITVEADFVRAELAHRETVEETRDFLQALLRYSESYTCLLIQVRTSKPVFHVERHGLVEYLQQIARTPAHRIALLAEGADLLASHEYLELLARQRGVNVRSFRDEAEALHWLRERRRQPDRRQNAERRAGPERRQGPRRAAQGGG
ncbi:MAG TPA: hypothetical protein VFB53_05710 [Burkholderiales bacterium]|nr:hypothetical protein [Burkholderiales bacterium]